MNVYLLATLGCLAAVGSTKLEPPPLIEIHELPETTKQCPKTCPTDCPELDISTCRHGVIKDRCNCCDVCKALEWENCWESVGMGGKTCDGILFCNIRHPNSHSNLFLPAIFKTGKCEPEKCKNTTCGIHQWCKLNENNEPVCHCKENCSPRKDPVCAADGTIYNNHCELRQVECDKQKKIPIVPCEDDSGICLGNDIIMKSGEVLKTSRLCEERICVNGVFVLRLNQNCLKENNFTCTLPKETEDLSCSPNEYCKISKKSDEDDYPHLGECHKIDPVFCFVGENQYKAAEKFINKDCTGSCVCHGYNRISCVSLCPPMKIMCEAGQRIGPYYEKWSDKCGCQREKCFNREEYCVLEKDSGPCYALFSRYYYNNETKTCEEFNYGGCAGNLNNFESIEECNQQCVMPAIVPDDFRKISSLKPPSKLREIMAPAKYIPPKRIFPYGDSPDRQMSSSKITISGNVIFDRVVKIKPGSCLTVTLADVSLQDVSSRMLSIMVIKFQNEQENEKIPYSLVSNKPVPGDMSRSYAIKAVLNIGWCGQDSSEWIRKLDYHSDTRHRIHFNVDDSEYSRDIHTVCYACPKPLKPEHHETINFPPPPARLLDGTNIDDDEIIGEENPFGGNTHVREGPKMSDEEMTIKGTIELPDVPMDFNGSSCFKITFEDVSIADASSVVIASVTADISKIANGKYDYKVVTNKPKDDELWRDFQVSAVLNVDWCPDEDSDEWLRKGDFLTDTSFGVTLTSDKDIYEKDFFMICYDCKKFDVILPIVPENEDNFDPFGGNTHVREGPKMSDEEMTIKGTIELPDVPMDFNGSSCFKITFEDVSIADASSVVIASVTADISKIANGKYDYKVVTNKPKDDELWRDFQVSAVLNVDWCPDEDSDEWLRKGDFLTDTSFGVTLTSDKDIYEKDFFMICYDCKKVDVILPIVPGDLFVYENYKGDEEMTIKGTIQLPDVPMDFNSSSCFKITFKDVSIADAASVVIASVSADISKIVNGKYDYKVVTKKPKDDELWRHFQIGAVLNVDWCPDEDSDEWLRKGDFLTDTSFGVTLTSDKDIYEKDFFMICYDCKKVDVILPIVPGDLFVYENYKGDEEMTIKGTIQLPDVPMDFNSSSCFKITFKDVSIADAASVVIASVSADISKIVNGKYDYKVVTKKPKDDELWRHFQIGAVLNVDWCPDEDSDEWLRKGDFLTDTSFRVTLTSDKDVYEEDFFMICYACKNEEVEVIQPISGSESAENEFPLSSVAPDRVMSTLEMSISGNVVFKDPVDIKSGSCMQVTLADVTLMDVGARLLSQHVIHIDIEGETDRIEYSLISKKPVPEDMGRTYVINAVLNNGWCKTESSEWIRKDDYFTKEEVRIAFIVNEDEYKEDIHVVCYDCQGDETIGPPGIHDPLNIQICPPGERVISFKDEESDLVQPPGMQSVVGSHGPPGPPSSRPSDKTLTISGHLLFPDSAELVNTPNCLHMSFGDFDESTGLILAEKRIDVTETVSAEDFEFEFACTKPFDYDRNYFLIADLHKENCDITGQQDALYTWPSAAIPLSENLDVYAASFYPKINASKAGGDTELPELINITRIDSLGPKMSDDEMTIKGTISFPRDAPLTFDDKSCFKIILEDASYQDVAAYVVAEVYGDTSKIVDGKYDYEIVSKKPEDDELWRRFDLGAVLNVGWCPDEDSDEWLRKGDFFMDTLNEVSFKADQHAYKSDFNLICYSCAENGEGDDVPEVGDRPEGPKMSDKNMTIKGTVILRDFPVSFDSSSCLTIKLKDVSIADAASVVIASVSADISKIVNGKYDYKVVTKKPKDDELWRDFQIGAVLNVDWCPDEDSDEWLRKGDLRTDSTLLIKMTKDTNVYEQDIDLLCFDCSMMAGGDETEEEFEESKPSVDEPFPFDISKSCFDRDEFVIRKSGERWKPTPCITYDCLDNYIYSESVSCTEVNCNKLCPPRDIQAISKCAETIDSNFWAKDACTKCKCYNGRLVCSTRTCFRPLCDNPVVPEGKCCPVCPRKVAKLESSCVDDESGVLYQTGDLWKRNPCVNCECDNGIQNCKSIDCSVFDCRVMCDLEQFVPQYTCSYANETYFEGETWNADPCTRCTCNENHVTCSVADCPHADCENPITVKGKCCPVCPEPKYCIESSTQTHYKNGDKWAADNFCRHCVCMDGLSMCATAACALPDCHPRQYKTIEGRCCPVCANRNVCKDMATMRTYTEGEIWQDHNCDVCKCLTEGHNCTAPDTNLRGCAQKVRLSKSCGIVCLKRSYQEPRCKHMGNSFPVGGLMTINCDTCVCKENGWECDGEGCTDDDVAPPEP